MNTKNHTQSSSPRAAKHHRPVDPVTMPFPCPHEGVLKSPARVSNEVLRRAHMPDVESSVVTGLPSCVLSAHVMSAAGHEWHRMDRWPQLEAGFVPSAGFFFLGSAPRVGQQGELSLKLKERMLLMFRHPHGHLRSDEVEFYGTVVKVCDRGAVEMVAIPKDGRVPVELAGPWLVDVKCDLSQANPLMVTSMRPMKLDTHTTTNKLPRGVTSVVLDGDIATDLNERWCSTGGRLDQDPPAEGKAAVFEVTLVKPAGKKFINVLGARTDKAMLAGRVSRVLDEDLVEVVATAHPSTAPEELVGAWLLTVRNDDPPEWYGWKVESMVRLLPVDAKSSSRKK